MDTSSTIALPGTELVQIDGAAGIVFFCATCHHAADPIELELDGETKIICTDCFLNHLIANGESLGETYAEEQP